MIELKERMFAYFCYFLLYFFNLLVVTGTQRLSPRPMHVMILLITSVLGLPPKLDNFDNML